VTVSHAIQGSTPADSLARALHAVFTRPEYRWEDSRLVFRWLGSQWQRLLEWLATYQRGHPTQYVIVLAVLVTILVAILVHFGYVAWRVVQPTLQPARSLVSVGPPLDDARAHLDRAAALAAAGRYAEALAHRFLALLRQLETRQALRFHPAKTPAEYVHEAQLDAQGRERLGALVTSLYAHLFGARPVTAEQYSEFGLIAERVRDHVASH
jgi:hypothetical protein